MFSPVFLLTLVMSYEALLRFSSSARRSPPVRSAAPSPSSAAGALRPASRQHVGAWCASAGAIICGLLCVSRCTTADGLLPSPFGTHAAKMVTGRAHARLRAMDAPWQENQPSVCHSMRACTCMSCLMYSYRCDHASSHGVAGGSLWAKVFAAMVPRALDRVVWLLVQLLTPWFATRRLRWNESGFRGDDLHAHADLVASSCPQWKRGS